MIPRALAPRLGGLSPMPFSSPVVPFRVLASATSSILSPFSTTSVTTAATASDSPLRVCVVGTGPAGFYTAKYLLKQREDIQVDMLDLLPTPFGLVRTGVAPDHPDVKSVQSDFESVAQDSRLNFLGNVALGSDINVDALQQHYNGVVLAYGAASDRWLNVPGEDLNNVHSARVFVNWYNGHPDYADFKPKLDCEDVVIIGQGNVAIDCARILAKTIRELEATDIASHALEALRDSKVKRIHLIGRRGHVQASFTIKELREVTRLEDAACILNPTELARGMTSASAEEISAARAKKRINDLLAKTAEAPTPEGKSRNLFIRFLLNPVKFLSDPTDSSKVGAVQTEVTQLLGDAGEQWAEGTGREETIPAGLVLKSIGYKSVAVDGVPFDTSRHVVRNVDGAVVEEDGEKVPGLYCVGWLKRGPSGIIGTNIPDAKQTAGVLLTDAEAGILPLVEKDGGLSAIADVVVANGKSRDELVTWDGFLRIDAEERKRGEAVGKPREKFTRVEEMIETAKVD